jgi:hypothetical protein
MELLENLEEPLLKFCQSFCEQNCDRKKFCSNIFGAGTLDFRFSRSSSVLKTLIRSMRVSLGSIIRVALAEEGFESKIVSVGEESMTVDVLGTVVLYMSGPALSPRNHT